MPSTSQNIEIPVEDGAIPSAVLGPEDPSGLPGLVVVPSIFGAAPDLIARLSEFADRALIALPDPFWRTIGGVVSYTDREGAIARLKGFDLPRCTADLQAVITWTRERCNGRVAGLGICFGGPFVLRFAGKGLLDGGITWHGSRMENFLERAAQTTCPLRLHFGEDDPITPPEAIAKIREAFASHPDLDMVVHPGAVHGFSHDGDAYQEKACRAGLDALGEVLAALA